MEKMEFLTKGFVNTLYYKISVIQNKLDEMCGDTINTIEENNEENYFVVTMVKRPYLKPQGTRKFMFTTIQTSNCFNQIVSVIELFN